MKFKQLVKELNRRLKIDSHTFSRTQGTENE